MTDAMIQTELVKFDVDDQTSVFVEVAQQRRGAVQVGARGDRFREAKQFFDTNLSDIREAAQSALAVFRKADDPDEVKLNLGIKMTAEAGAVIARTAVEGTITVELVWKRPNSTIPPHGH